MKKLTILTLLICFLITGNAQKLLRSSYSEVYNQFKSDPDVHQVTTGQAGSSSKVFVSFKNGDKYSFTFAPNNYKLYGMTLVCSNDNSTNQRFTSEVERRSATVRDKGNYVFYDEQGRGIYLWLTVDDLGRRMINWEAQFPFKFD